MNVWPELAPGEQTADAGRVTEDASNNVTRITDVANPQLFVYRAEGNGPHPAVLVCPGGGYQILAADKEGTEVARWLNGLGYTAAVLHYRVPDKREGAFQDGQRALSLLRTRADEFGIDLKRLGVLGFSAGGHLSARLAVGFGTHSYAPLDKIDTASCRPDFALLIYPAYLMDAATGQPAAEVKPRADMPPVFLTQTQDDSHLCAPAYADALKQVGVSAHCIVYADGGHGYGLRLPDTQPAHAWPDEAAAWLREQVR